MKIRSGDTVKVLYGKDAGKTGKVVRVLPKKMQVVVEGVNIYKRHLSAKRRTGVKSEVVDIVKPLHIAKVMLVDEKKGVATRVGYKMENGKKVRFAKRGGAVLADAPSSKSAKKEVKEETEKSTAKKKSTPKKSVKKTESKSTKKSK